MRRQHFGQTTIVLSKPLHRFSKTFLHTPRFVVDDKERIRFLKDLW